MVKVCTEIHSLLLGLLNENQCDERAMKHG